MAEKTKQKRILCFGAGLQTTALAIMIAKGELEIDEVIFADTGAEKPETYWYIENYIKPLFGDLSIPFVSVRRDRPYYEHGDLYAFLWRTQDIPSVHQRRCTDHFKIRPIKQYVGNNIEMLIGFSLDEAYRARRGRRLNQRHPLIERQMTAGDCHMVIAEWGWPIPYKSSCYFCPFQRAVEWKKLKLEHSDLFQKALDLEANYHARKPHMKNNHGLLGGTPLWRIKYGLQPEMFQLKERSCWSGHCGH